MYKIGNDKVTEAITGLSRTFRALLEFRDGDIISGADVGEITVEHIMSDDNTAAIGRIISKRAEINVYSRKTVRRGDVFRLYLYLLDRSGRAEETVRTGHRMLKQWTHRELSLLTHSQIAGRGRCKDADGSALGGVYIPFGELIAAKVVNSAGAAVITAYDRLQFSDKVYVPEISFPAGADDVTDDVLRKLGIAGRRKPDTGELLCRDGTPLLDSNGEELICAAEYAFTIAAAPYGKTCREVLGYIAAMYGRNGMLDRDGVYTTFFISSSGEVQDADRIDEPEIADDNISISGLRCTVSAEAALTAGDSEGVYAAEFECPYMTGKRLEEIWREISRYKWRPAQIYARLADPCCDLGDMGYLDSAGSRLSIPVTALTYHFDGGLSADITSCGQVEETDDVSDIIIITVYSSIGELEKHTIAELEERTIAELEG